MGLSPSAEPLTQKSVQAPFGHGVAVAGSQGRQPLENNTIPPDPAPGATGLPVLVGRSLRPGGSSSSTARGYILLALIAASTAACTAL